MSRFVSAGAADAPTQRDADWLAAQARIESAQAAKKALTQQETKSLYDTLQENKLAKQEAFEESIKLKHQFRALDDDEADFLNSLSRVEREAELQRRRDEAKGLESFREAREKAERDGAAEGARAVEIGAWEAGKKRKRERKGLAGVKVRKVDATPPASEQAASPPAKPLPPMPPTTTSQSIKTESAQDAAKVAAPPIPKATGGLGVAGYGSDSDDD